MSILPQKLYRNKPEDSGIGFLTKAILREDGVHFIDLDNKERKESTYPSVEVMNKMLKDIGFPIFEVVVRWPRE